MRPDSRRAGRLAVVAGVEREGRIARTGDGCRARYAGRPQRPKIAPANKEDEDMVAPMTSRQRVLAALRREPVDRTPVCNPTSVATVELMDLADAPFPEACRKAESVARLAATSYTELGFDTIMPVYTIIQESSALGCKIQWEQKDNWPTVKMREPIWEKPEDIKIPADLLTHNDTKCILDAIRILRKEFGNEIGRAHV